MSLHELHEHIGPPDGQVADCLAAAPPCRRREQRSHVTARVPAVRAMADAAGGCSSCGVGP